MTIRILIVDDHAVVRQGLRLLLDAQDHIEVIGEAADGETAVQMARTMHPDVILMDLLMPEMDGIETTRVLLQHGVESRILMLTSSLEDQMVKAALRAGAHGYILKASRSTELIQAIERIAAGQNVLDPAAAQVIMQQVRSDDPLDSLTAREREVFDLMAHGQNNHDIAEALIVSEATVRTHVGSILDKLMLRDRTQVMIYALKRGFVRLDDLP